MYYNFFVSKYIDGYRQIDSVIMELSSKCNLKCKLCTHQFKTDRLYDMSYEKAVEYYNKLPQGIKTIYLHFSGEPFINSEIARITSFLSNRGIYTVVSTNGTMPLERYLDTVNSGLSCLIFAIDGATNATHSKYRQGSNFDNIFDNLKRTIEKRKSNTKIGVQFLVTKDNEDEIPPLKEKLEKINVDFFNLKTISFNIASNENLELKKHEEMELLSPRNPEYSRYYYHSHKLKYPIIVCSSIYEPVICASGDIGLCCIDIDNQVGIGNLNDSKTFLELWQSGHYREIRKKVLNKNLSVCQRCNYSQIGLERII